MPPVEQELLILPDFTSVSQKGSCCSIFIFLSSILSTIVSFLFFLLAIGLTILCPLIASDYPFGMIFKLFFRIKQYVYFGWMVLCTCNVTIICIMNVSKIKQSSDKLQKSCISCIFAITEFIRSTQSVINGTIYSRE